LNTTQNNRLRRALERGQTLTALSGFRIAGTFNLHKRLDELELAGLPIERGWRKVNGKRLRTYKLAA
jgi:hypothetical protein